MVTQAHVVEEDLETEVDEGARVEPMTTSAELMELKTTSVELIAQETTRTA